MANTFKIGDMDVLVVSDGEISFPGNLYFQGTTPEQWEHHKRWLDHQGRIQFTMSCFIVSTGGRKVLIDTGLGQLTMFAFKGGALIAEMAAAGVKPEDIDTVFVTHLHIDHCGTCMDSEMRPIFPNATYRWTSDEAKFWSQKHDADPLKDVFSQSDMMAQLGDRMKTADDGDAIAPGINVIATPGHTPGHAGVILSSGTDRAFLLGDAISCPVQLEEPEWSGMGDLDKNLARRTQEAVLNEIEGSGALLGTAHFPGLTFGRVLRGEGKRYWQPVS